MSGPLIPRQVRLQEFAARLRALPPTTSGEEAKRLIDDTLNAVEDELTDIPYDPSSWRTDGRMYPVQDDNASDVDGHPDVTSYRSRKHETLIRTNGAFEIRDAKTKEVLVAAPRRFPRTPGREIRDAKTKEVLVAKPGSDGQGVWS